MVITIYAHRVCHRVRVMNLKKFLYDDHVSVLKVITSTYRLFQISIIGYQDTSKIENSLLT